MNSLTRDEFDSLLESLGEAQNALNTAAEILSVNQIDTPLGNIMSYCIERGQDRIGNAILATNAEIKRLKKEASEDQVTP